jgi:hypothetical protein
MAEEQPEHTLPDPTEQGIRKTDGFRTHVEP